MLTSQKLLYILPDVAYIAELLPTKKEHTFAIHVFRQINGEFLDDNEFITENLEKLVSKIDAAEYHLVLPDFLFTNTIVEVPDTNEAKVKNYIADKLLPSLEISEENYAIETFTLTQHQGKSKVQLSALEKSVVAQFASVAREKDITITGISPLSWTIKSVVSLEPSISVIQMGSMLYVGLHYIGLDQASQAKVEELENIAETIKTLKGGEPSIQTVYLLTNELVADNLKELASDTVPMQQLATFKEEETQMPSYVKQIIEAGMKTLDITEYHTPSFSLPKEGEITLPQPQKTEASKESQKEEVKPTLSGDTETDTDEIDEIPDLPLPTLEKPEKASVVEEVKPELPAASTLGVSDSEVVTPPASVTLAAATPVVAVAPSVVTAAATPATVTPAISSEIETKNDDTDMVKDDEKAVEEKEITKTPEVTPEVPVVTTPTEPKTPEISLAQFAPKTEPALPSIPEVTPVPAVIQPAPQLSEMPSLEKPVDKKESSMTESTVAPAPVVKNPHSGGKVLQMVFVTAAVFFATVGIGVGIGLAVLSLNNRASNEPVSPVTTPVATPVATPTPTPATASPSAQLKKEDLKILVVNATTIAGHAGKTKKALETDGFGTVTAGNAKGTYSEKGTFVLMKTEDQALITALKEASELDLTFQPGVATEDPQGQYAAVIVLAE